MLPLRKWRYHRSRKFDTDVRNGILEGKDYQHIEMVLSIIGTFVDKDTE